MVAVPVLPHPIRLVRGPCAAELSGTYRRIVKPTLPRYHLKNVASITQERQGHTASKQMFGFSILYLFLLFAVLLVDRLWGELAAQAVSRFAA